jgi:trans-aconitate methyltransferase
MMMARTPSNLERILWTLSLLDLKPDDRVLEVGFGPGIAIKFLADRIPGGAIAGLDHSEVMAQQASKRNARAIQEGRVTLHVGDVSSPPVFDEPFDKIFTINSIHFWDKPVECLSKLCELMNPGGVIAVTLQPRSRGATDDTTIVIGKEVAANLIAAGFSQCRLEIRHTNPVAIACAIGIK